MNVNDWHERWQENRIGFHRSDVNVLLVKYFHQLKLKQGDTVFVPLCGKSVDMLWLAEQGLRVVGVEVSPLACEAFFTENSLEYEEKKVGDFQRYQRDNITIFAGDYFDLTAELLGKIDAVYDRAALIALPEDVRTNYASHLSTLIDTSTQILLLTMAYNQTEMSGPPFSVGPDEVQRLYGANLNIEQLYEKFSDQVSEHLQKNGLQSYTDYVFLIS